MRFVPAPSGPNSGQGYVDASADAEASFVEVEVTMLDALTSALGAVALMVVDVEG